MKFKIFQYNSGFVKHLNLVLILIISFIYGTQVNGQGIITTNQYLISVEKSYQVKSDTERIAFLSDYNYNLPLIRGAELRSESNDFLIRKQEYSLRVSPNSLSAISNQKKVYQNKIEKVEIQNQLNFNKELKKRYFLLVDYIFTEELNSLYQEKHVQIKDKLTILGQSVYDLNFDVNDLIDTEQELINVELKLANLKDDKFNQLYVIRQFLNFKDASLNIDLKDLISAEQIIQSSIPNNGQSQDLSIRLQKLKLNTLENEMKLSIAKSNQVIDFFQAKYNSSKNFIFEEDFSVGIGINLPFFAGARQKKGKYYFDKLSAESKLVEMTQDIEDEQKRRSNELKSAMINYQTLKKQIAESNVGSILSTYKKMVGVSPIVLLKLSILQHDKKIEMLKSKHDLFKNYIRTLESKGTLYQKPLRNYLSSDMKLLLP